MRIKTGPGTRVTARRSPLAVALAAFAVAALLAGCGGSSSSSTNSAASGTATTSSGSTSTTATASSGTSSSTSTTSTTSTSASSSQSASTGAATTPKPVLGSLSLSSSAFKRGGKIPTRYTCDGANESPPLQWQKPPAGTAQLFLFALDLAGGQNGAIRWAVGAIPSGATSFPTNQVPSGAVVGRNSTGSVGYAGVCPPAGKTHSIVFLLYALRDKINVSSGFDPRTVQRQLNGHTAAAGLMFGTYKRP